MPRIQAGDRAPLATPERFPRPRFRIGDVWSAPVHDFPIRDEILFQYLSWTPEMDVLEIGAGSGYTAYRLAGQVRSLTLIDIAADNVSRLHMALRGFSNIRIACGDICDPKLPEAIDHRFDTVFGLEVFEYLPDPGTCLKNVGVLLKPGGRLLLEFPNYPPPKSPGVTCFRTRGELEGLLRAAGFGHWEIYALRLRPYADLLFREFHERPIRVMRALRSRNGKRRAMRYDETWTFYNRNRLNRYKYLLHSAWAVLGAMMRLGGDCFERRPLGSEILNHDLLVVADR